jgi:tRNA(fMet)-specific endonuclease VapC
MFMLDTNVLVAIAEGDRNVLRRITELSNDEVAISTLVEMEFRTHVAGPPSDHPGYLLRTAVLDTLKVYPFDSAAAVRAAELRRGLLDKGQRANRIDTLIAGHAVSLGKVLVTNNTKDFEKIPDLKLDNWSK